jgi:CheY-like chemotaxis protein
MMGGSEKILLVEDHDLVREQVTIQLGRLGYQVVVAEDGLEALDALKACPDVRLLLTDVVMPRGLNGLELAAEARKLRPDLPVLLTSGYSDQSTRGDRLGPAMSWLNKPYLPEELAAKIRAALDSRGADLGSPDALDRSR